VPRQARPQRRQLTQQFVGLGRVGPMKVRRGEQAFDSGYFRLHAEDQFFHPFQLLGLFPRQLARP